MGKRRFTDGPTHWTFFWRHVVKRGVVVDKESGNRWRRGTEGGAGTWCRNVQRTCGPIKFRGHVNERVGKDFRQMGASLQEGENGKFGIFTRIETRQKAIVKAGRWEFAGWGRGKKPVGVGKRASGNVAMCWRKERRKENSLVSPRGTKGIAEG